MKCSYCFRISRFSVQKKKGSRVVYYSSACKSEVPKDFIRNIDSEQNEAGFRDWFCVFFQQHGYTAISEQVKGNKNIDLVVEGDIIGRNKIEFKDWRNNDKKQVVRQLCTKYLTSFDKSGFVFMINPNKSSILERYKELITSDDLNYCENSWKEEKLNGLAYYISFHKFGAESKTVYHYIFDVYP